MQEDTTWLKSGDGCLTIWLRALLANPALIIYRHGPRMRPLNSRSLVHSSLRILLRPAQGALAEVQIRRAIDAIRHRTAGDIHSIRLIRARKAFRRGGGRRRGGRGLVSRFDAVDPGLNQRRGRPLHLRRVRGGFGDHGCHGVCLESRDRFARSEAT